ncbi:MAG: class I SAM-dependent methyltransferase [Proteobacteria bacterium]|nr:class I SAM-dependent methyltransferase [Desulfobulbaceae bacterium]MBU4152038.1 class I SAM-dependent methyltransferase [Pseudomonadota bacterium]
MAGFPEDGLQNLHQGRGHFWFRHRNMVIERSLRRALGSSARAKVLELGCGSCLVGGWLVQVGFDIVASDRDSAFIDFLPPGVSPLVFDLTRDDVLPDQFGTFDAVVLGDVIEHLQDPVSALRRARDFLRPGGCVVVTVPALQSLWSEYDEQSMHVKRYERDMLQEELREAGFFESRVNYFMFIPALLLYVQRRLVLNKRSARLGKESLRISPLLNRIMAGAMTIEGRAMKGGTPLGSSIIATGTKP